MWIEAISYAASNTGSLSVNNPLVLGPVAAFIFTIFVTETVVSGKAYKRERDDNIQLRSQIEKIIPLAETMVTVTKESSEVIKAITPVMEEFLDQRDGNPTGSRRRRI